MCGIAGYLGSFDHRVLEKANDAQSRRGPDAEGVWWNEEAGVGLGHRRLSILDLSPLGAQPMISGDGAVVLVFNGEIYNFQELRKELEDQGHNFCGQSDTEVLLQLYLVHGKNLLSRLNGIFAFALWDEHDRSLFVARDAMGVKPFYYAETSEGFAFASEIKALLCIAPELRELDIPSLHRYLAFLWCPGEGTPLRSVRKLLPGEAMILREGRITQKWRWYELPAFRGVIADLSLARSLDGIVDYLRQAVHRQMVADVPLGAFLSGGLDSSSVVAFARERAPDIRCFTIEVDGCQREGTVEDLPYARQVARHLAVPLEVVKIRAGDIASDIEFMIRQLDEPLADPACLNVLYICRLAREQGLKVLLSGCGGDDLFTGYRRHTVAQYEHLLNWLPKGVKSRVGMIAGSLDQRVAAFRKLAKALNGSLLTGDARIGNYFLWTNEQHLLTLYTPQFRAALGENAACTPFLDFLNPLPAKQSPLERMLLLEQRFFLADHNLNYTDKMSMAVGVEARVPFLDLDLVEHAARIPIGMKQKGMVGKWILKKAMEPYLPHNVIYRRKTGFGAPLRQWIRHELRELVRDTLSEERLRARGLFDPTAVRRLIEQNDIGKIDGSYLLLSLVSIEIWCSSYIDQVQAVSHGS